VRVGREPGLLRRGRRGGCRGLVVGPAPVPLVREAREPGALRAAAAALRRIRRAGLLTVAHLTLGREGDDAGVFARAVWLSTAGRVAFPRLAAHEGGPMSPDELGRGLAWAVRALHRHRAIWRRTGIAAADSRAALIANYRLRRAIMREPTGEPTPAMRLARALARPLPIREQGPSASALAGACAASGAAGPRSATSAPRWPRCAATCTVWSPTPCCSSKHWKRRADVQGSAPRAGVGFPRPARGQVATALCPAAGPTAPEARPRVH